MRTINIKPEAQIKELYEFIQKNQDRRLCMNYKGVQFDFMWAALSDVKVYMQCPHLAQTMGMCIHLEYEEVYSKNYHCTVKDMMDQWHQKFMEQLKWEK